MPLPLDFAHRIERTANSRAIRYLLGVLAILLLLVAYNLRDYRNLAAPEAMDGAQLARNIAEGKGFTTQFIRPFSLHLVKRQNPNVDKDPSRMKTDHPDIANAPVYPLILAAYMKVMPFNYSTESTKAFWNNDGRIRYQPDFLITIFNEILFLLLAVVVFFWARRSFDKAVAWTSAFVLLGTELFWRFSISGLSTILLLLIFMGVVWSLTLLESEAREPKRGPGGLLALAFVSGLITGVGCLTRYSFGWLIIPVLIFLALFSGPRRIVLCGVALAAFALVVGPWAVRNYHLSGMPFGTATYNVLESTTVFPDARLERSLEPDFSRILGLAPFWSKFVTNTRTILINNIPRLGGGWIGALFLTGLLVGFRNPSLRRIRYFGMFSLIVLVIAQAVGQTHLSQETPEINSENLLVIIAPLVVVLGVAMFFMLLDQIALPTIRLRPWVIALFCAILWLPLVSAIVSPKGSPVVYPPYYPPQIQQISKLLNEHELMMSDIPWAVAWYGDRQSVWLTLNATRNQRDPDSRENFTTINDYQKQINALYLTPETLDNKFLSQWINAGEFSWGSFCVDVLLRQEVPPGFPLRQMPTGFTPRDQLPTVLLFDWARWKKSANP